MTAEHSVSKPPLITPSASPPSRAFFPQPYRIPDKPSPTKRPRLASTSSHLQSHLPSSSSSSTSLDQIDVQQAREASTLRLFDVWSTLADRYSRPIDEDDIIDITTGELVKDRGVLRNSRNWVIGCFADHVEEDEDEDEDEDDVDELDAFANPGDEESGDVVVDVNGRRVPPVTDLDPADAEDLKQFLEAERRRREICGSEEDTEDSEEESLGVEPFVDKQLRNPVHAENTDTSPVERSAPSPQVEKEDSLDVELDQTPRREPSVYVDSGSDDELVNWDMDEASMIYRLPKKEDEDDRDSDIEIIDTPALPHPSPSPPRTKSNSNTKAPKKKISRPSSKSTSFKQSKPARIQLQTPPQSQSSSFHSSTTPSEDYFTPLPPESSLGPCSSSPASYLHNDSSPTKPRPVQRPAAAQVDKNALPSPIPRLDLAKMAQGRAALKSNPNAKPVPRPRTKEKASELASKSSILERVVEQGHQDGVSEPLSRNGGELSVPKRRRSQVEVVIERSPFPTKLPVSDARITSQPMSEEEEVPETKSSVGRKASKGKGREIFVNDPQEGLSEAEADSDDPITIFSSSPVSVSKVTGRSHFPDGDLQSASDSDLREAANNSMNVVESPNHKYGRVASSAASTGTKKRKRVASSSESASDVFQQLPEAIPMTQSQISARAEALPVSRMRTSSIGSESSAATLPREPETRPRPTRKGTPRSRSRSQSRSRPSNHDRDSSPVSSQEDFEGPDRRFHRAPSHFDPHPHSEPPYYAYHQPPYTSHHSPHQPHLYPPMADPRAQFIITQAMRQLSALVAGPWTPPTHGPMPYTPSHHRTGGPGSLYSTPTHHPHPYPYAYDPNLSRATLPPDSPDVPSSPAMGSGSGVRRKSLVKRSRSRGRRVSFRVEEECVDTTEVHPRSVGVHERDDASRERNRSRVLPTVHKGVEGKGKGKSKADMAKLTSELEAEPEAMRRGRSHTRAQTPGPLNRTPSSSNKHSDSGDQGTSFNRRGRSRSVGVAGRRT